jgi:hypothetical protein
MTHMLKVVRERLFGCPAGLPSRRRYRGRSLDTSTDTRADTHVRRTADHSVSGETASSQANDACGCACVGTHRTRSCTRICDAR